ncbi:MAG: hypothetical protein ACJAQR_001270 [Bacteroidia bacterium]|jgi:hypothetical protein
MEDNMKVKFRMVFWHLAKAEGDADEQHIYVSI